MEKKHESDKRIIEQNYLLSQSYSHLKDGNNTFRKTSFVETSEQTGEFSKSSGKIKSQINIEDENEEKVDFQMMNMNQQHLYMVHTLQHHEKVKKAARFTQDGRKCAEITLINDVPYPGCTIAPTPDGKNDEQEWCNVDENETGSPRWGYCDIQFNFDALRKKVFDLQSAEIPEIQKIKEAQQVLTMEGANMVKYFGELTDKQTECVQNLERLKLAVNHLKDMETFLGKLKFQWEDIAKKTEDIKREIDDKEKDLNRQDDVEGETPPQGKCVDQAPPAANVNCEGLIGYENEPQGNGLIGYYFDNENFQGEPEVRSDDEVDFDWHGDEPIKGINPDNYSIRWKGFVKAPITSQFTFRTKCDDAIRIFLNDQLILDHNFKEDPGCYGDKSIFDVNGPMQGVNRDQYASSIPVEMTEGMKYEIIIENYHSVHDRVEENADSFVSLMWECEKIKEEVIPKIYLFTTDKPPPLKMAGVKAITAEQAVLQDGDTAFKDSELYILQDIPQEHQGAVHLKTNFDFTDPKFEFDASEAAIIFVAVPTDDVGMIGGGFAPAGAMLTVIKIAADAKKDDNCVVKAFGAMEFLILKKDFPAGPVEIPIIYESKKEVSMVVFYKLNPKGNDQISCGGEEIICSDPRGDGFASCAASTFIPGYECEAGFANRMKDGPGSMWVSDGEGMGAMIEAKFKHKYQINKIEFQNRDDPGMRNKDLEISIGAETFKHTLRNTAEPELIMINPPTIGDSVKITVKSVYTKCKNGGSINIYGTKCMSHAPKDPKKPPEPNPKKDDDPEPEPEPDPSSCDVPPSVDKLPKDPKIVPQVGEMIQAVDESNKKWVPAIVKKVEKKNEVTVEYTNIPGKEITDMWPSHKMRYKPPRLMVSPKGDYKLQVCFTAKDQCPTGYIPDNGNLFGPNRDYVFGWSRDMQSMTRIRTGSADPLLANMILFPPDKQSNWCLKGAQDVSCESANWQAEVPNGNYFVTITAGDADEQYEYCISVNNRPYMENMTLNPNQFFTEKQKIVVLDGRITITSVCDNYCDKVWSRINAVIIEPMEDENPQDEEEFRFMKKQGQADLDNLIQNLGCGNAFTGGRCEAKDSHSVENCIFDSLKHHNANKCKGLTTLMHIPQHYQCIDQRNKYKCVQIEYQSRIECQLSCPGDCFNNKCKKFNKKAHIKLLRRRRRR